jgi:hypothetical protein
VSHRPRSSRASRHSGQTDPSHARRRGVRRDDPPPTWSAYRRKLEQLRSPVFTRAPRRSTTPIRRAGTLGGRASSAVDSDAPALVAGLQTGWSLLVTAIEFFVERPAMCALHRRLGRDLRCCPRGPRCPPLGDITPDANGGTSVFRHVP